MRHPENIDFTLIFSAWTSAVNFNTLFLILPTPKWSLYIEEYLQIGHKDPLNLTHRWHLIDTKAIEYTWLKIHYTIKERMRILEPRIGQAWGGGEMQSKQEEGPLGGEILREEGVSQARERAHGHKLDPSSAQEEG